MSVVNLEKGGIELTLTLTFKVLVAASVILALFLPTVTDICFLTIKAYLLLRMESKRGASSTTPATGTGSTGVISNFCNTPAEQAQPSLFRSRPSSRLTHLTGTLAGCAISTSSCQGPLGPAVTRDSGPSETGTPANSGKSGVALAVTPASVVALAATPALVAALAATPAATPGSGDASRPLPSSKPLSLYICVLVFYSPLNVFPPFSSLSFLIKLSSAPSVTGASR